MYCTFINKIKQNNRIMVELGIKLSEIEMKLPHSSEIDTPKLFSK